jgi:hypothetical protein
MGNHRMLRSPKLTVTFLLAFGLFLVRSVAADPLTEKQFTELHKQLQPADDEPWRTIPWNISLLDAQRLAAEQKKPLFIWAMDGHPLGCT